MKRWAVPPLRVRVSKCQGTSAGIYMIMIHDSHPRPQRLNRVSLGCADSQRLITLIPNREHGEREDGFRSGLDFSSNATRSLGWLGGVRMDRRDGEPATHRATEPRPEPWRVCYPGKSDSARSAHTSPGCSGERKERHAAAARHEARQSHLGHEWGVMQLHVLQHTCPI
jgi:hypothetical protein